MTDRECRPGGGCPECNPRPSRHADDPGDCVRCGDGKGGVCPHGCDADDARDAARDDREIHRKER